MWWPAIGGVFAPCALDAGYDTIQAELNGTLALQVIAVLVIVKAIIWCAALGSCGSGGVIGTLESRFLPGGSPGL